MDALEIVKAYICERYEADLYRRTKRKQIARERSVSQMEDDEISERAFEIVREAGLKYWVSATEFSGQIYLGWPSEFDPEKYSGWSKKNKGDLIIIAALGPALNSECKHVYHLRETISGYKIFLFETQNV